MPDVVELEICYPEYSMLVLLDPSVQWDHEDPEVPRYRDRGDRPTGTFAGTGAGWITAQAPGMDEHLLRLELHDRPPPADHGGSGDALEAPYRSSSGGLCLTTLTGGVGPADVELGDAEWYRVRVARRHADDDARRHLWTLQFWPDPAIEPPVWLARSRPATVGKLAEDIEAVMRWTTGPAHTTTTAELAVRLLVGEQDVSDALAHAEEAGLLRADDERFRVSDGGPAGRTRSAGGRPTPPR